MGTEQEGARPSLPTGEDSIDVMKNPNDYNPIYDSGYPGDRTTWQDVEDDRRHNKQLKNQETIQKGKETFKLLVNNKGDEEDLMNLTFQEAIQKSRMYPGSKIVREKRR